ncbi:hypothetical protein L3Q82_002888 [Scortum barcoo]|uniref:Uncharacterized protein n=1 Tax=Scortum barcoo TaxID=214431 RepID=A0ACB8VV55_9TELE|nr:hypothetical protein L3Q82_002888 [Scortum barcoo]
MPLLPEFWSSDWVVEAPSHNCYPNRIAPGPLWTFLQVAGSSYGREMMTGYLAAQGVHASEGRVGRMLAQVHEPYHQDRQQDTRNLNPQPYQANYMGHKLHMDQTEKLAMYGVTHVVAIDGFSSKVVAHSTMPIKNNLTIYKDVYRHAVLTYGLWDQNHTVERIWPEINQRVNYPVKMALQMIDQETLDLDDQLTRYCTSNVSCQVSSIGMQRAVQAWNAHRIPGPVVETTEEAVVRQLPPYIGVYVWYNGMNSLGFQMSLLDIGGGFCGRDDFQVKFEECAEVINDALEEFFPPDSGVQIIAEPGRYYVESAFTLAANVIAKRVIMGDMNERCGKMYMP